MNLKGTHILRKLIGLAFSFAIALHVNARFYFEPSPTNFFSGFLVRTPHGIRYTIVMATPTATQTEIPFIYRIHPLSKKILFMIL